MRFTFAIIVAALVSAKPIDDVSEKKCPDFCWDNGACQDCYFGRCVSISRVPRIDVSPARQNFPLCEVSCVSAFSHRCSMAIDINARVTSDLYS